MTTADLSWRNYLYSLWRCRATPAGMGPRARYRIPRLERLEPRQAPAAHDTLATAIPLALDRPLPAEVSGTLATPNHVDLYAVQLNAGDEVTADVSGQNLGSPQSYLRLFSSSGQQLAFAENTGSSSQTIVTFDALASGEYYVGVSSNGDVTYDPNTTDSGSGGLTTGAYTLTVVLNGSLLVVNSALDPAAPGAGTLRSAVNQANRDAAAGTSDTIVFDTTQMGTTTIRLAQGSLKLTAGTGTITIDGGGQITLSGNNASHVFQVDSNAHAFFTGLTIQEGNAGSSNGGGIDNAGVMTVSKSTFTNNSASSGGGIENEVGGTLTVTSTTFNGNLSSGNGGGGIDNTGTLTVSNSTFIGNTNSAITNEGVMTLSNSTLLGNSGGSAGGFTGSGGGIGNTASGTLTVVNTTIADNFASDGGGIYNAGTLLLVNTIVAGNSVGASGFNPDIEGGGEVTAATAYNLIGEGTGLNGSNNQVGSSTSPLNPLLGPLGNYGGVTQTIPLLVGSPALAVGGAVTSLSDAVTDATSTTITVQDASAIASTEGNYLIQIDGEQMLVTNVDLSNNTLTVVRGVNDTTAATHSDGADVFLATDQRGLPRSATPDLGAFQSQEATLTVSPSALPAATAGQPYSTFISAAGGSASYDFTLASGTLPTGLSLSAAGVLSGTVTTTATFPFIVLATDTLDPSLIGSLSYSLFFNPPFPSPQPLNSSGTTVRGGTYVNGTPDYYSLTATTTGGLSASVTALDGTTFLPRLTLYGALGQVLIQSDAGGSGNASAQLNQHLQPGAYYLAVSAFPGTGTLTGNGSYVLDATFVPALPPFQALPVGNGPFSVAVGDFNHEGNLDLVTANFFGSPGTVSVFLGLGDGSFGTPTTYTVGGSPFSVAVGDFTNDGNLDIVTANFGDPGTGIPHEKWTRG